MFPEISIRISEANIKGPTMFMCGESVLLNSWCTYKRFFYFISKGNVEWGNFVQLTLLFLLGNIDIYFGIGNVISELGSVLEGVIDDCPPM